MTSWQLRNSRVDAAWQAGEIQIGQSGQSISKFPKPLHVVMALTIRTTVSGKYGCEALSIVFSTDGYLQHKCLQTTWADCPSAKVHGRGGALQFHSALTEHLLYAKSPLDNKH